MNILLLLGAPAARLQADTLVMVASRDAFDWVYAAAAASFVLLLLFLLFILLNVLAQIRGAVRSIDRARTAMLKDEAVENLRRTTGHVESMAASLRTEADRVSKALGSVSEQVDLAAERMEERIEEFNALLAVVQEEAEEAFLDTASTARGVRSGLGELARNRAREAREERRRTRGARPEPPEGPPPVIPATPGPEPPLPPPPPHPEERNP
jgi:hypothetical protein